MGAMNSTPGRCCAIHAAAPAKSAPRRSTSPTRLPGRSATTVAFSSQIATLRRAPRAIDHERDLIRQRVADKQRAHAVPRVEIRFERQQAQDEITGAPMVRTLPWRHAHTCGLTYCTVRKSARLQARGKPEIEFRCVDADEHLRPRRDESLRPACGAVAAGAANAAALP